MLNDPLTADAKKRFAGISREALIRYICSHCLAPGEERLAYEEWKVRTDRASVRADEACKRAERCRGSGDHAGYLKANKDFNQAMVESEAAYDWYRKRGGMV